MSNAKQKAPQPERQSLRSQQPRTAGLLRFWPLAVFFAVCSANAGAWRCDAELIRVHDGDTLSLRCPERAFKLRLSAIDAPEYRQAQGQAARAALVRHLQGHKLRVESRATDRYGRVIGDVWLDEESVSLWMIAQGWAWCAQRASANCNALQQQARQARLGLWQDQAPIAPWIWRAQQPR